MTYAPLQTPTEKPPDNWAWLLTSLAGGQGLSGGPGIITREWLSLSCASPNKELRQAAERMGGGGGATATEVLVCFGLLLITVPLAAKPRCLRPLHQSNAPAGPRYSPFPGLAALW